MKRLVDVAKIVDKKPQIEALRKFRVERHYFWSRPVVSAYWVNN